MLLWTKYSSQIIQKENNERTEFWNTIISGKTELKKHLNTKDILYYQL